MDYLFCACPVKEPGCKNTASYWIHADSSCGSRTKIRYNDIHIICSGCGVDYIMFRWKFSCSAHDYKPASNQGCIYALSILGQHYGREDQIQLALGALMREWPKYAS